MSSSNILISFNVKKIEKTVYKVKLLTIKYVLIIIMPGSSSLKKIVADAP